MKSILTGATGAIGTALIKELFEHGSTVYAVLNPLSKRNDNIPSSPLVKKIFCGIDDYAFLPEKISEFCKSAKEETPQFDTFFHLAWQGASGVGRNDAALQEQNVRFALDAVQAAKKLGCCRFIGIGSQAEYGRVPFGVKLSPDTPYAPETEYGKNKLIAGNETRALCEKLGIEHIWVRVLSVYGPNDGENALIPNAIRLLLNGERPHYTKGEQIWDYLYSGDAAEALRLISEKGKPFSTYVLGSGEAKPLKEYLKILHEVINPDIQPVFGEVPYSEKQVMYLSADISSLTHDTGFVPKTDFYTGIKGMI